MDLLACYGLTANQLGLRGKRRKKRYICVCVGMCVIEL